MRSKCVCVSSIAWNPLHRPWVRQPIGYCVNTSWQKNDDLRVQREKGQIETGETIARLLAQATRSTGAVVAFLAERGRSALGSHRVREADARQAVSTLPDLVGRVDAVITSPPYATALPYIDTDRLNLVYLGLLPRESHRERDTLMIGNREVTTRSRGECWAYYEANKFLLPRRQGGFVLHGFLNPPNEITAALNSLPAL